VDPTYDERMAAARTRLIAAFDLRTDDERRYVDWLIGFFIPAELEVWSLMVERRAGRVTPDGRPSIADVLRLVDKIRVIAFDRSLTNDDIARGIRDALREHAGEDFGDND
jgi:hypothetical protein